MRVKALTAQPTESMQPFFSLAREAPVESRQIGWKGAEGIGQPDVAQVIDLGRLEGRQGVDGPCVADVPGGMQKLCGGFRDPEFGPEISGWKFPDAAGKGLLRRIQQPLALRLALRKLFEQAGQVRGGHGEGEAALGRYGQHHVLHALVVGVASPGVLGVLVGEGMARSLTSRRDPAVRPLGFQVIEEKKPRLVQSVGYAVA